jgi:hypothetical protein
MLTHKIGKNGLAMRKILFNSVLILFIYAVVLLSIIPQPSSMKLGEKLIQGDLPIIEYRKRRAELKTRAKELA